MKDAPCKGCNKRDMRCHARCDKYKEYIAYNEEIKAKKAAAKDQESALWDTMRRVMTICKRQNRKGSGHYDQ